MQKIKSHLKLSKQHRKVSYILLSCLFVLFAGYQNCKGNKGKESNPREASFDVTITPGSNTATQATVTWKWKCNQDECTYAHAITNTASKPEFNDGDFSTATTITKSFKATECVSPPCTYYLHVQAMASGSKSEVKSVSVVLGPQTLEVINIQSDTTPRESVTWNWDCSIPPCTYRYAITTTATHTFAEGDEYGDVKTARKADVNGTYYLHVQAKKEADEESAVKSVQAILETTKGQIATGTYHSCFLSKSGAVKCWGDNSHGQLGLNDDNSNDKKYIGDQTDEVKNLSAVHLGKKAVAIATSPGAVFVDCNQSNHYSTFPGNNAEYVTICNGQHQEAAARRTCVQKKECELVNAQRQGYHTCAILEDGKLKCWGRNDYGQLGLGSADHKGNQAGEMKNLPQVDLGGGHKAKAVALGSHHTCAILDNDCVKCWGLNDQGQLGYDATNTIGVQENQMGANLAPVGGNSFKVKAITAGHAHTCAITKDDYVKCWGRNDYGQLGLDAGKAGDNIKISDQAGEFASLRDISLPDKAKSIVAGSYHTCAILQNDKTACWGLNDYGQLGFGHKTNIGDDANEMGQLQIIALGGNNKAKAIAAGTFHTCVLSNDGHMKCFGQNGSGQLGIGNTTHIGDGPNEMGDHLKAVPANAPRSVAAISAGGENSCFILDNGDIKCWGDNKAGQLGQGNKTYIDTQGQLVNNNLGDNESVSSFNPIPLRINGQCGAARNTCLEGTPNDDAIDDTATHYKWKCEGTPGSQAADCSIAISS